MEEKTEKNGCFYTKDQLLGASVYANRRDALCVLLEKDKTYTLEQVNQLLTNFMEKEV